MANTKFAIPYAGRWLLWSFNDYVDANGNPIQNWRGTVSDTVRAAFDAKVDILHGLPPAQVRRPLVGKLEGYEDVYELRFKAAGIAWRILFCFGPDRHAITFLFPAREVNDRFEPLAAPAIAAERAARVRSSDSQRYTYVTEHDRS